MKNSLTKSVHSWIDWIYDIKKYIYIYGNNLKKKSNTVLYSTTINVVGEIYVNVF